MKANDDFLAGNFFKVQSDEQIRFWKDIWLGDKPFSEVYPNLYKIVRWRWKDDTVANVLWAVPLNVSCMRGLVNENWISWDPISIKSSTSSLHKWERCFSVESY